MKSCPRCATVAAGASMKCRNCGALLVAPPVSVPAPHSPAPATAEDRFFAPATVTAVVAPPRQPRTEQPVAAKRGAPAVPVLVVLLVVACAAAAYGAVRSGSGGTPKAPVVLPAVDESGLPSLGNAVRIQAESARQRAFAAIAQASAVASGAPLDAQSLRDQDPTLQWVAGERSSTGPDEVSFAQSSDGVTIAVSAKSRDVCAFGRWSPGAANRFVTMGNVRTCRATDAPAAGWTERSPTDPGSRYAPPDGY